MLDPRYIDSLGKRGGGGACFCGGFSHGGCLSVRLMMKVIKETGGEADQVTQSVTTSTFCPFMFRVSGVF